MQQSISVVIPVFNRSEIIKDALSSVFMQTLSPHEIIVIDDASDDSIEKTLYPYRSRVKYHRLAKNSGVSAARNQGIEQAESSYIALLDSDDLFLPNKLQLQYDFMISNSSLISHTMEHWLRGGKWINHGASDRRGGGDIFKTVLDKCRVSPSTLIFHKKLIDEIGGFDESLRVCEDYEFILRSAMKHDVAFLDKNLTIKRAVTNDQLSNSIKHIESVRLEIILKFMERYGKSLKLDQFEAIDKEIKRKRKIVKVV